MPTLCYQLIWKTPTTLRAWKRPGPHAHKRCDDGWTVDSTTRSGWQGSRTMQVMFVLGLEFAFSKADELAPSEITRIGLQDDMTFMGSVKACWPKQVTDSVATNAVYGRLDSRANPLRRPLRRLREWRRLSRRCRALRDLRAINMTMSALQRRGC